MKKQLVAGVVLAALASYGSAKASEDSANPPASETAATLSKIEKENAQLRKENAALREQYQLRKENDALRNKIEQGNSQLGETEKSASNPVSMDENKLPRTARPIAYLPTKAPPPVPVAAPYSWTGFYIGGNAGYGWHDQTASFAVNDSAVAGGLGPFLGAGPPISFNISGPLGGLQLGYNWQFNQNWVAGFETDFDFANIRGNGSATYLLPGPGTFNSTANETIKWFGTVRARLGYLPMNNLLVYGTGGFAYSKVDQSASHLNPNGFNFFGLNGSCLLFSTCYTGTSSRTATGWTAGAGAEYAFMNNWTFKAEYLFVNLGSNGFNENVLVPGPTGTSSILASFNQTTFHVVRGGLNYRF